MIPGLALGSTFSFSLLSFGLLIGGFTLTTGLVLASNLLSFGSLSLTSLLSGFASFFPVTAGFSFTVCSSFSGFFPFTVLLVIGSTFFLPGTTDLLSVSIFSGFSPFLIVLDLLSLSLIDLDLDFSSSFLAVLLSLIVLETDTDSFGLFLETAGLPPLTSFPPLVSLVSFTSFSFGLSSFFSTGLGLPASIISSLNLSTKKY